VPWASPAQARCPSAVPCSRAWRPEARRHTSCGKPSSFAYGKPAPPLRLASTGWSLLCRRGRRRAPPSIHRSLLAECSSAPYDDAFPRLDPRKEKGFAVGQQNPSPLDTTRASGARGAMNPVPQLCYLDRQTQSIASSRHEPSASLKTIKAQALQASLARCESHA